MFYNPLKNTGYIVSKLKNIKFKRSKIEKNVVTKKQKTNNFVNDVEHIDNSSEELSNIDEDLEFFKNCVVSDQKDVLMVKLEKTLKQRRKLFQKPMDIFQNLPFFFFDPSLVSLYLNLL